MGSPAARREHKLGLGGDSEEAKVIGTGASLGVGSGETKYGILQTMPTCAHISTALKTQRSTKADAAFPKWIFL